MKPVMEPWPEDARIVRLYRWSRRCTVLGPGVRAVLWVQGCVFRCPGCVAPETLPFEGGEVVDVAALTEQLLELPDIDGVTFSGGEPMSQAAALCALIDRVKARRDLSFLSYSGYTLEQLERGEPAQRQLLRRLDVLIDGLYVQSRHTDLRWRGSDNQRVHFLTDRYTHLAPLAREHGNWLEFEVAHDGSLEWMGIPPRDFRDRLPSALAELGILLQQGDEP